MEMKNLIACARGDARVDLALRHGRVVNVLSGEIQATDVAIAGSTIVGFGDYEAEAEIDLEDAFLAPGFIDAHVHVESSMVTPSEFARAVVPLGTTAVVTDPHEIANVLGLEGIRFMMMSAESAPLSMYVMASSCVPATHMATSGAALAVGDLEALGKLPSVLGLAEVMNFPGVVHADPGVLAKLRLFAGRVLDGHCPGLGGKALAAYVAAGIGSDHECTTVEEAQEKLRLGMMIFLREASTARNLRDLLPLVTPENHHRICLCTDDRQPADLLDEGHVDHLVRMAIAEGLDPLLALRLATCNPAGYFGLRDRGAVAPGRRADLIAFRDLGAPRAHLVICGGQVVARDGEMVLPRDEESAGEPRNTMDVAWDRVDLAIRAGGQRMRIIGIVADQIVTEHLVDEPTVVAGEAVADPGRDLLKMAVIERHHGSGAVGKGFVKGMGLQRGALASSVAHDHHNLVVIGADDTSMLTAARRAAGLGGGLVVAADGEVLAEVPLPLAGLMSAAPIEEVRRRLDSALEAARELGAVLHDPFGVMSFLSLEVIPRLKLTDQGLVDVDRFQVVPLWIGG